MKNLRTFVLESFEDEENHPLNGISEEEYDAIVDEFLNTVELSTEDEIIDENLRRRAKAFRGRAKKAYSSAKRHTATKAKNAASGAKKFVKSLWHDDKHY